MSNTKKIMIALAVVFGLWIINDPAGAAGMTDKGIALVGSALSAIPVFLSNVVN